MPHAPRFSRSPAVPARPGLWLAAALACSAVPAVAQTPPADAPPPAPAATPAPPPASPPAMVPLGRDDASAILGRPVLDGQGNAAGRVTDVLVDAFGAVKAAVVDFGGFLGVGQRRIAVAWSALRFDPATHSIRLTMSAPELSAAPEYKPDSPTNAVATRPQDISRPSEKPPSSPAPPPPVPATPGEPGR